MTGTAALPEEETNGHFPLTYFHSSSFFSIHLLLTTRQLNALQFELSYRAFNMVVPKLKNLKKMTDSGKGGENLE